MNPPMRYDAKRDLFWLLLRPWVGIPRMLQVFASLLSLAVILLLQGSSLDEEVQKRLAKRLFRTLTNLVPCFIKLGQALSTRPDLVNRAWLEELTSLQDNLPDRKSVV